MREANAEMAMFIGATFTAARFERRGHARGTDLRGSSIAGVTLDLGRLRGLVLDPAQAMDVVEQMGVTIKPAEDSEA